MILIVCLDDNNGMMFNKRRQSKDAVLRADMIRTVGGRLWMNSYSSKQFEEDGSLESQGIIVDEDCINKAGDGEYCFIESGVVSAAESKIEKLIIYKWNRIYPADMKFDIDLNGWKLESATEFAGKSHEKITKEIYIK